MAIGWLVLRQPANLPIGKPDGSSIVTVSLSTPDEETVAALQATIAGFINRLDLLESEPTPVVSPELVVVNAAPVAAKTVFPTQLLYLGAGSTVERDWTETGAQLWLNSRDYPADVKVIFQARLSIFCGEAWARLKNKTTGAIISVTEIFNNTDQVVWKSAPAFKLHPGNNLYVVEIKSSSGETANLSGSRVQLSQ